MGMNPKVEQCERSTVMEWTEFVNMDEISRDSVFHILAYAASIALRGLG